MEEPAGSLVTNLHQVHMLFQFAHWGVLRVRLFTRPHSVWCFVALGAEGCRQEINPLEPWWLADFAGHQCVQKHGPSNLLLSETNILFFWCWPQRQAGKTPQMVTFTCSSCYVLVNNTLNTLNATAHGFICLSVTINMKMDYQNNISMKEV